MLNIDTSKILDQQMNRKQFLRNVGVGVVAMTGVAAALKAITQVPANTNVLQQQVGGRADSAAMAYGGSAYGGTKLRA
jgi:hypothetical protein